MLLPTPLQEALTAQPQLPDYDQPQPRSEDFPPSFSFSQSFGSGLLAAIGMKQQAEDLLAPAKADARQRFEAALRQYEAEKRAFEEAERAKVTPEILEKTRRRQAAAQLEKSQAESMVESRTRMGHSEAHLHEALARHFPNLIERRRILKTSAGEFHPDYLLYDPGSRLKIDIELDEPYNLRLKAPIHFVEWEPELNRHESLDAKRDNAFLAAGWPVVRFSEEQAVRDPDGCARVVAEVIQQVTGQAIPDSLQQIKAVAPHPRWTREEANRMASAGSRDEWLEQAKQPPPVPQEQAQKPKKIFAPSPYQQNIFDFLKDGEGHGLVVAVAGSGKSTTLLQGVSAIREKQSKARIVMLAFNRSIKEELKAKLSDAGFRDVEVYTLNGFGNSIIKRNQGSRKINIVNGKPRGMLKRAAEELGLSLDRSRMDAAARLFELFQSYVKRDPNDAEQFKRLAKQYNVNADGELQDIVARALELTVESFVKRGEYTIDEQNYLPVKLDMEVKPYDFVFVDECQDLTQTQLELVTRAAGESGRLLFVGDPRQAIMGFRGADNDSVHNIRHISGPVTELPLTVCYRCPSSHIELAQDLMPDIKPAPTAKRGEVYRVSWDAAFDYVQSKDLMFARNNRLVDRIALELFARGFTLDYQSGAPNLSDGEKDGSKGAKAVADALYRAARDYQPSSSSVAKPKLEQYDKPLESDLLPWALQQIYQQSLEWDGSFEDYVEMLTRPDERLGVRVSSAHQSKGLEADRVFVMGEGLFAKPDQKQQDWEFEQEENLKYVALTRAKDTLFLVGEPEYAERPQRQRRNRGR